MLNVAIEEIAKACASSALILMVQELGTLPIQLFGTDEQKDSASCRAARRASGRPPSACPSPRPARTRPRCAPPPSSDGDEWVINGTKNWITNAGVADFYVVFAVTDREAQRSSAFIVEKDAPGFSVRQARAQARHQGLADRLSRSSRTSACPSENMIGEPGKGLSVALGTLERTRLGAAAQAVGIAQGAIDYANDYAKERIAFGKPINELQAIQFKLADMETRRPPRASCSTRPARWPTATSRAWASTPRWPSSSPPTPRCGSPSRPIQVLGGYGYVSEYPVERMMRDAKITQIYEGTNEIQRLVIARAMR